MDISTRWKGLATLLVVVVLGLFVGVRLYQSGYGRGQIPHYDRPSPGAADLPGSRGPSGSAGSSGSANAPDLSKAGDYVGISTGSQDFFIEARLERDRTHGKQLELLNTITADPGASGEALEKAQAETFRIVNKMEKESRAEALIRAKGYSDAVVFLGDGSCDVVVATGQLTPESAGQVGDIVARTCGVPLEKVTIIERRP